MNFGKRTRVAILVAASLLVLPPEQGHPSMKPAKSGSVETVLKVPIDRSLRLSVRISGARKEGKRASYFKSIARQRMARKTRQEEVRTAERKSAVSRITAAPPRSSGR